MGQLLARAAAVVMATASLSCTIFERFLFLHTSGFCLDSNPLDPL